MKPESGGWPERAAPGKGEKSPWSAISTFLKGRDPVSFYALWAMVLFAFPWGLLDPERGLAMGLFFSIGAIGLYERTPNKSTLVSTLLPGPGLGFGYLSSGRGGEPLGPRTAEALGEGILNFFLDLAVFYAIGLIIYQAAPLAPEALKKRLRELLPRGMNSPKWVDYDEVEPEYEVLSLGRPARPRPPR